MKLVMEASDVQVNLAYRSVYFPVSIKRVVTECNSLVVRYDLYRDGIMVSNCDMSMSEFLMCNMPYKEPEVPADPELGSYMGG
jgi:hypothetical protein